MPVKAQSADDRVGIGYVGVGGQGSGDSRSASRFGNIVAIADGFKASLKDKG